MCILRGKFIAIILKSKAFYPVCFFSGSVLELFCYCVIVVMFQHFMVLQMFIFIPFGTFFINVIFYSVYGNGYCVLGWLLIRVYTA